MGTARHTKDFEELQAFIAVPVLLRYIDPANRTRVVADAIVCWYSSERNISQLESNATQTDGTARLRKRPLALVWTMDRDSVQYLIGMTFELETDHRPLEAIFATKNRNCAHALTGWVQRLLRKTRQANKYQTANVTKPQIQIMESIPFGRGITSANPSKLLNFLGKFLISENRLYRKSTY